MTRRHRVERAVAVLAAVVAATVLLGGVVLVRGARSPMTVAVDEVDVASTATPQATAWPLVEAAYAVPSLGLADASPSQRPQPIASLTKMATALVVVHDLPLGLGAGGPTWTVTAHDVAAWHAVVTEGGSNLAVKVGERLDERQLLEGLLIHSANNFARMLVELDGRSDADFVAQMNAVAHDAGLSATHYVDPSGFPSGNVSTAADQVVVTDHLMANPTLAAIVARQVVVLPDHTVGATFTPLLGTEGVVGAKTGYSSAAGACDAMVADVDLHGAMVPMVAVVLGVHGSSETAGLRLAAVTDRALLAQVTASIATTTVPAGTPVLTIDGGGRTTTGVTASAMDLPIPAGHTLRLEVHSTVAGRPLAARSPVGVATVTIGRSTFAVAVVARTRLEPSSWLRRLG